MDREPQEDSNGVIESFWDGHGVEFKAKYVFGFGRDPKNVAWRRRPWHAPAGAIF